MVGAPHITARRHTQGGRFSINEDPSCASPTASVLISQLLLHSVFVVCCVRKLCSEKTFGGTLSAGHFLYVPVQGVTETERFEWTNTMRGYAYLFEGFAKSRIEYVMCKHCFCHCRRSFGRCAISPDWHYRRAKVSISDRWKPSGASLMFRCDAAVAFHSRAVLREWAQRGKG